MCAKLLLLWQMKSMCKAFVIVANEEYVQSFCLWRMKSVCKVLL